MHYRQDTARSKSRRLLSALAVAGVACCLSYTAAAGANQAATGTAAIVAERPAYAVVTDVRMNRSDALLDLSFTPPLERGISAEIELVAPGGSSRRASRSVRFVAGEPLRLGRVDGPWTALVHVVLVERGERRSLTTIRLRVERVRHDGKAAPNRRLLHSPSGVTLLLENVRQRADFWVVMTSGGSPPRPLPARARMEGEALQLRAFGRGARRVTAQVGLRPASREGRSLLILGKRQGAWDEISLEREQAVRRTRIVDLRTLVLVSQEGSGGG